MSDVDAVRAAQDRGQRDAQHRQAFYRQRPGQGVAAGTTGSDPRPLPVPADRAVAGTAGGR
jgi:hypothetical protein